MRHKSANFIAALGATLLLALAPSPAAAAEAQLVLDGGSHFVFPGDFSWAWLPAGTSIPISLQQTSETTWTITIAAAAVDLPPVIYPDGHSVTWALDSAASGLLTVGGGSAICTIQAPLNAYADEAGSGAPMPLSFTTEAVVSSDGEILAATSGQRLDLASGQVELVAAGLNPGDAITAPGQPFYAVLSGQIVGLPSELTSVP